MNSKPTVKRHSKQGLNPRLNQISAAEIDYALELQSTAGTMCAIEFMKGRNIDHEVIYRVLTHPEQRRASSVPSKPA